MSVSSGVFAESRLGRGRREDAQTRAPGGGNPGWIPTLYIFQGPTLYEISSHLSHNAVRWRSLSLTVVPTQMKKQGSGKLSNMPRSNLEPLAQVLSFKVGLK